MHDKSTYYRRRSAKCARAGSDPVLWMIMKKPKSKMQRARCSGIGTNTSKTSLTMLGLAIFDMKTPSRAAATNSISTNTRISVMEICHKCVLSSLNQETTKQSNARRWMATAPTIKDWVPSHSKVRHRQIHFQTTAGGSTSIPTLCYPTSVLVRRRLVRTCI